MRLQGADIKKYPPPDVSWLGAIHPDPDPTENVKHFEFTSAIVPGIVIVFE